MYEILVNTHINYNVHNTYKRQLTNLWYTFVYICVGNVKNHFIKMMMNVGLRAKLLLIIG